MHACRSTLEDPTGLIALLKPQLDKLRANEPAFVDFEKKSRTSRRPPRWILVEPEQAQPRVEREPEPEQPAPEPAEEVYDPVKELMEKLKEYGVLVRAPDGAQGLQFTLEQLRMPTAQRAQIFSHSSQLLPPERLSARGTLYKFGVSVRVVHVPTSRAAWFGVAETQHVDFHMAAVSRTVQTICRRMVDWQELGRVSCRPTDPADTEDPRSQVATFALNPPRPLHAIRLEVLNASAQVERVAVRVKGSPNATYPLPLGQVVQMDGSRTALVPPAARPAAAGPPGAAPPAAGPPEAAEVEAIEVVYREPRSRWGQSIRPMIAFFGRGPEGR